MGSEMCIRDRFLHSVSQAEEQEANLEVARHGTSVLARPHGLNESGVCRGNLSTHAEWILTVELITPLIRQHVLSQRRHIAHALHTHHTKTNHYSHSILLSYDE